ncbi:MAG: sialidase family protein [Opitutales bacterium]
MERLILLLAALACATPIFAQPTLAGDASVAVFEAKKNLSHASVRIPALLRTKNGTLIAVAEARDKATDQAGNDLVVATSKDDGVTWSKPRVAYDQGQDSCNNPCLVQDARSGRVFIFFQTFPAGAHEFGGLPAGPADPKGTRCWYLASDDDGATWSKPTDVSASLKPAHAVTVASGPGIGIQLRRGPVAGRLVIPFNSQDTKRNFVNWVAYSDDGGKTWQRGAEVPQRDMQLNEVQVAETGDGSVYLNSRRWKGSALRKTSWSKDGGETWSPAADDAALPEPTCQGSLLTLPAGAKSAVFFLNPAGKGRANGTLRRSDDGGRTWAESTLLFPGPFAYSSMAPVAGGIGVLYEPNSNTVVLFRRVTGLGLDAR